MQCQKEQNLENCPCSHPGCARKGMCCDCVSHHKEKGEIPACFFPADEEEKYISSRSVDNFIKATEDYRKGLEKTGSGFVN
jgi:hypothetical protein